MVIYSFFMLIWVGFVSLLHAHMDWICTQIQPHPHTWKFQLAKNFVTAGFVELPFHTKYVLLLHPFSGASLSYVCCDDCIPGYFFM